MSDILLAKPILPPGFIDTSVGEPHVVRENLLKAFELDRYEVRQHDRIWEYPFPTGYAELVDFLERKHKAKVIITNGAKQALGACFHSLKRMGKNVMGMRSPYWALIPPLAKMHGLDPAFINIKLENYCNVESCDSYLCLAPNNPDGDVSMLSDDYCQKNNMPFIHDAAYYTHVYLPPDYELKNVGDVQIFSISKMLGLSGLRLGYVVCHNLDFYKYIQEYMESMTVGVSILPQIFLADLFNRMESYPSLVQKFEVTSHEALLEAKKIALKIRPEVLEVPETLLQTPGMFGWFKVGPQADFNKAKVNVIDGSLFGVPGMIRMNLAFNTETMEEIVNRLNSIVE
jgi:aspartate/methionine/tyrosine aminotransferase